MLEIYEIEDYYFSQFSSQEYLIISSYSAILSTKYGVFTFFMYSFIFFIHLMQVIFQQYTYKSFMNLNFRSKKTPLVLKHPAVRKNKVNEDGMKEEEAGTIVNGTQPNNSRLIESRMMDRQQISQLTDLSYHQYLYSLLDRLEPRDHRVIIPFPFNKNQAFSLESQKHTLEQWIGDMYFNVVSASFQLFLSKQLSYEQVKIYCSENLLLNVLLFFEKVHGNDMQIYEMMSHINKTVNDCLMYLLSKYPQMKQAKPNKKLREAISSLNNMENDQNDMVFRSNVEFNKKQQADYTPEIMQFINYIVGISSQKCEILGKQTTYAKGFTEIMEKIFQWVQFPPQILSEDKFFQYITKIQEKPAQKQQQAEQMEQNQSDGSIYSQQENQDNFNNSLNNIQLNIEPPSFLQLQQDFNQGPMMQKIKKQPIQINMFPKKQNGVKKVKLPRPLKRKASTDFFDTDKSDMNEKQLKEYREKVKKYTNYKIGVKINPNTELFTQKQINNGNFKVKNTAILRVLTKWIEELEQKIFDSKKLILNRSFRFKAKKGLKFIKLNAGDKADIHQGAQEQVPLLRDFIKGILNDCIKVEGSLAKTWAGQKKHNIPKYEYLVGKFCSKLESAASTYLVNYLNRIIDSLVYIVEDHDEKKQDKKKNNTSKRDSVSLITFKTGDLLRCKCSSHENQILRIFNMIKRISESEHDIFKIIRIKDRLEMGTRDIMINILFMKKVLCEIQLAVTDEVDEKQKMYDGFNHYLYELKRSNLGPIMESSCIWTHLDQRSKQFKNMKERRNQILKNVCFRRHPCSQTQMKPYRYAFVCSLCATFYSRPEGIIQNKKCFKCNNFYQCNQCIQDEMDAHQLKQFLGLLQGDMKHFENQFSLWKNQTKIPTFSIFIPRKSKKLEYFFVQKLMVKGMIYFVVITQNQNNDLVVKTIYTLKNGEKKQIDELLQQFFIYQWMEKRNFNKTLSAKGHLEKLQKEQQEYQKKANQMEKRRKQIKQKVISKRQNERKRLNMPQVLQEDFEDGEKPVKDKNKKKKDGEEPSSGDEKQHKQNKKQSMTGIMNLVGENEGQNKEKGDKKDTEKLIKSIFQTNKQKPPSRASSRSSLQSSNVNGKFREHLLLENDLEVNIQIFEKRSERHNVRIAYKRIKNKIYYLILNFFMTEGQIKMQIKQQFNKNFIQDLLSKKNEVLFLEEERLIDELDLVENEVKLYRKSMNTVNEIYLDENMVQSIKFLQNFPRLQVLHANHNYIQEMSPILNTKQLTQIEMNYNQIYRIMGLDNCQKLTVLKLCGNHISQIEGFNNLTRLQVLDLRSNQISKIQNLENLKLLVELDLSINQITQIQNIGELRCLQTLDLSSNQIQKIENIENLTNLVNLYISVNKIQQISGLDTLCELKVLMIEKNQIKQIKGLSKLKKLQQLWINNNLIRKIENLEELTSLTTLQICNNFIENIDYESIEGLSNLKNFNAIGNSISIIPRDIITFLPKICDLNLLNNPIKKTKMENKHAIEKIRKQIKSFPLKIK